MLFWRDLGVTHFLFYGVKNMEFKNTIEVSPEEFAEYLKLKKISRQVKDTMFDVKKRVLNLKILNDALIDLEDPEEEILDLMVDVIYDAVLSFDNLSVIVKQIK